MYRGISTSDIKIDECIEEFAPRTHGYQMYVLGGSRGYSDVLGGIWGDPPPTILLRRRRNKEPHTPMNPVGVGG